jgi:hypothetical protein
MPGNLFSEDETTQIVKRAAQLQEEAQLGSYTPGVTEEELERIAAEMGVNPEFLRLAIEERQNGTSEPQKPGPFKKLVFERVIEGEVAPEDFDLLHTLPISSNQGNLSTQIGRTFRSTTMAGFNQLQASITSREGRTRVRIESRPVLSIVFGLELILFGIIFGAVATVAGPIAGLATFAGLTGAGLALLFKGPKWGAQKSAEIFNKICGQVAEIAKSPDPQIQNAPVPKEAEAFVEKENA